MTRPRPAVSFEFFPPADEAMEKTLWDSIRYLEPLNPRFVSVTYGADGSTRERTHNVVSRVQKETRLNCVPHLTCIGASPRRGARHRAHVLGPGHSPHRRAARRRAGGHRRRTSRARMASPTPRIWWPGLKTVGDFEISVAAYPEKHPEAPSAEFDLDVLKRKIDAGATRAITQFFYDTDLFLRFRDACAAQGITAPIVPGILPITRFPQVTRFAKRCGASIPDVAGASLRRAGRQPRDAQADLRRGGDRAGARAATSWRRPVSFLHAEPRRAHLRHLPRARRSARSSRKVAGRNGRSNAATGRRRFASCSPSASSCSTAPWAP